MAFKNHQGWLIEFNRTDEARFEILLTSPFGIQYSTNNVVLTDVDTETVTEDSEQETLVDTLAQQFVGEPNRFHFSVEEHEDSHYLVIGKYGLQGGGFWKNLGFVGGLAQIAGGAALIVFTGGLGGVVGSGLVSSGLKSCTYSWKRKEEEFSPTAYAKKSAAAFVGGAAYGAISPLSTQLGATAELAEQVIHADFGGLAYNVAMNSVGAVASTLTEHGAKRALNANKKKPNKKRSRPKKTLSEKVGMSAIAGMTGAFTTHLSGYAVTNIMESELATQFISQFEGDLGLYVSEVIKGFLSGNLDALMRTPALNVVNGVPFTQDLAHSMLRSGLLGSLFSVLRVHKRIRDRNQHQRVTEYVNAHNEKAEADLTYEILLTEYNAMLQKQQSITSKEFNPLEYINIAVDSVGKNALDIANSLCDQLDALSFNPNNPPYALQGTFQNAINKSSPKNDYQSLQNRFREQFTRVMAENTGFIAQAQANCEIALQNKNAANQRFAAANGNLEPGDLDFVAPVKTDEGTPKMDSVTTPQEATPKIFTKEQIQEIYNIAADRTKLLLNGSKDFEKIGINFLPRELAMQVATTLGINDKAFISALITDFSNALDASSRRWSNDACGVIDNILHDGNPKYDFAYRPSGAIAKIYGEAKKPVQKSLKSITPDDGQPLMLTATLTSNRGAYIGTNYNPTLFTIRPESRPKPVSASEYKRVEAPQETHYEQEEAQRSTKKGKVEPRDSVPDFIEPRDCVAETNLPRNSTDFHTLTQPADIFAPNTYMPNLISIFAYDLLLLSKTQEATPLSRLFNTKLAGTMYSFKFLSNNEQNRAKGQSTSVAAFNAGVQVGVDASVETAIARLLIRQPYALFAWYASNTYHVVVPEEVVKSFFDQNAPQFQALIQSNQQLVNQLEGKPYQQAKVMTRESERQARMQAGKIVGEFLDNVLRSLGKWNADAQAKVTSTLEYSGEKRRASP